MVVPSNSEKITRLLDSILSSLPVEKASFPSLEEDRSACLAILVLRGFLEAVPPTVLDTVFLS